MTLNPATITVGLLALVGLGLFVFNLVLGTKGFTALRRAKQQMAAHNREQSELETVRLRSEALRAQVKELYGSNYALAIESVDMLIGHSVTALLANDSASALELLNDACHEMEQLIKRAD